MALVEAKGTTDLRVQGFVPPEADLEGCPLISTSHAKLNWPRAFVAHKDKVALRQRANNAANMNFNALFKLRENTHWPMDHERMAVGSFGDLPRIPGCWYS
jgi:hypothetical protein